MTHYIDIELKPTKELRENILLNQVYTAFHKRLYDLNSKDIGVSFPRYRLKLGTLLRVHASQKNLEKLEEKEWLGSINSTVKFLLYEIFQNKYSIEIFVEFNKT